MTRFGAYLATACMAALLAATPANDGDDGKGMMGDDHKGMMSGDHKGMMGGDHKGMMDDGDDAEEQEGE